MGAYNVITRTSMVAGQPEDVSVVLANLDAIAAVLNGGIDNSNVNAAAALAASKLAGYPADVTKFLSGGGTWIAASSVDGWTALSALTYGTTDGHTFTATYSGDLTASVPVGSRVKLTNQAATQYFIVTAHVAGTLTLYGGTTYSITNTAITNPFFSREKCPVGFPLDKAHWTEQLIDTTLRQQISPVNGTWYNLGSLNLVVPIGAWDLAYDVAANCFFSGTFEMPISVTLSTTTTTETDTELTSGGNAVQNGASNGLILPCGRAKSVLLAAKATYSLLARQNTGATQINFVPLSSGVGGSSTRIRAICSYL